MALFAFMGSMLGLVLSDNVLLLFVFWELTGLTSFLLIGFEHDRQAARRAATQELIVTGGGGLALLAAGILVVEAAGTPLFSELMNSGGLLVIRSMWASSSAGDALPQRCQVIEIRVAELRQLFNAIDPSPFRQRDLDPRAEEFIVDWARDLPMDKPWALVVHLDRPAGRPDEAAALREAIHEYFGQRVVASRRTLRELFRRGRISLVIALAFLTASIAVGDAVAGYLGDGRLGEVIREGFLIGGWVAMWRPLEVFLYDWWPIRAEGRLLQRLSTMPVRIEYKETAPADAWRSDWPEVPAAEVPRGALTESRARNTVTNAERAMESEQTGHQHTPEEERRIREAALDKTIADSFPASDPPSSDPNPDDHSAIERERPTDADLKRRKP